MLSQKDPRWANILLGTSNYYIWAKGCLITEIADALGITPNIVNERLQAVGGFAPDANGQVANVIWAKIAEAFPGITVTRQWAYNNDDVLAQLAAGNKVLVEVPADPIGNPGGKHWVRYLGNHLLNDPWTGTERPTGDFPNPSGYAVISGIWQAPQAATPPQNSYLGLDLKDEASVKAAIDTWQAVANGQYVKADEYTAFVTRVCAALGIDDTTNIQVIIDAIATLRKNFADQVQAAATIPSQAIEGQGPAVAPVSPTLANIPVHEKESILNRLRTLETEIKALLGI